MEKRNMHIFYVIVIAINIEMILMHNIDFSIITPSLVIYVTVLISIMIHVASYTVLDRYCRYVHSKYLYAYICAFKL